MYKEIIVNSRPDREIRKQIITPGDYNLVPYEDSRCRITLSDVICTNGAGKCDIDPGSRIFSSDFDGNVLIGDCSHFLDKDFELVLQQMCCGETCQATIVYRDSENVLAKEISCKIVLREVTEEQLISDWSWEKLYEAGLHHKECGVELVKEMRIKDAFRRFSKALKMLIAIEPIDLDVIDEKMYKQILDVKVKLYNNLAHCQLQYNEYTAALALCNQALKYDPDNVKALYRRSVAYSGLDMIEEAWKDIQQTLKLDPANKIAKQRAKEIKPKVEKITDEYNKVIKKMFP